MTDADGSDEIAADGAVDIGAAIQRGVELLAQQSVETPTFQLRNTFDLYTEGVRAVKSRAPAARALQAWAHLRQCPAVAPGRAWPWHG